MKETLFYTLAVTSNVSTVDGVSRLMRDNKLRSHVEQEISNLLRRAMADCLEERAAARSELAVELIPLKDALPVIGPPA